jgi:hypothetical protein
MIRETLVTIMKAAFPDVPMTVGTPPDPIIVIPAKHPQVGAVSIRDEGDEVAVHIGDITHGHFGAPDASLSQAAVALRITASVVEFLQDLFADRVLLWRGPGGVAGGWRVLASGAQPAAGSVPGVKRFLWYGPIR